MSDHFLDLMSCWDVLPASDRTVLIRYARLLTEEELSGTFAFFLRRLPDAYEDELRATRAEKARRGETVVGRKPTEC